MRDTANLFLRGRRCFNVCRYAGISLDNNTFNLLLVAKVDIPPDPNGDKGKCSDGSSCNAHIPLSDTKSDADCVSGWTAGSVLEGIEVVRVDRCGDVGRQTLIQLHRVNVCPDATSNGVSDCTTD